MSNFQRSIGYMRPAGQTAPLPAPTKITLPSGVDVQIPAGVTPASTNTQGQLVDANGAVILDTSGNPIQVSQPQQVIQPVPATTTDATPVASTAVTTAQHVGRRLIPILTTVLVVGGAAYLGSFYGARRAVRRHSTSRRPA